jgi:hypothetical protein
VTILEDIVGDDVNDDCVGFIFYDESIVPVCVARAVGRMWSRFREDM